MNPVLALPAAFGLAGATGLNATLPLLIVSLLARLGMIQLAPPFDALATDVAFWGLLVLAVVEFAVDKVPALDSVGRSRLQSMSRARLSGPSPTWPSSARLHRWRRTLRLRCSP
jgi:hypothetical protein